MKIFIQGLWHCGCVISACLASLNHKVIAYDDDQKIINNLKKNITPIFEPGLKKLIETATKEKKLSFSNNLKHLNSANIIWFTYDTPVEENDQADTKYVLDRIKNTLKELRSNKYVIVSSQLPVGTIKSLEIYSKNILKKRFYFFSCPENLRLGNSLSSFLHANRMIVGYRDSKAKKKISVFLQTINKNLLWMKIESAEITKHALNSFLASSISFINEISSICEYVNADAREVEEGLKSESRIGRKAFLSPGSPFSGGTLGRDLNYLNEISKELDVNTSLLSSIRISNNNHKKWIYNNLKYLITNNKIKKISIWGLTYTENTNTLRSSFAIEISNWLNSHNISVSAYDGNIKKFPPKIKKLINKLSSPISGIKNIDVLIILNKSEEFLKISPSYLKKLNKNLIIIDPSYFCNHFDKIYKNQYISVGKSNRSLDKISPIINYNYNLKNQTVLITGASKGLGYEIAKSFLKSGSNLMICSRNLIQIKNTYAKLCKIKKKNQKIFYSVTDVSSFDQVKQLIQTAIKKFKRIDVLVNNAGIYGPMGYFEKTNWDEWVKSIQINLFGSILLCRTVIPHFKKNNKGKIIQLSGGGAASPLPFISSYAVSKAAIVRFVENLSEEVKNYNIDINAVAPGPLNTGMLEEVLKAGPKKVGREFYNKSLKQKETGGTAFNKVCELILFLGSKYSDGIRGKLISALWDDWKNWINYKQLLKNSDTYTLRRIIGRDRGFEWGDK